MNKKEFTELVLNRMFELSEEKDREIEILKAEVANLKANRVICERCKLRKP